MEKKKNHSPFCLVQVFIQISDAPEAESVASTGLMDRTADEFLGLTLPVLDERSNENRRWAAASKGERRAKFDAFVAPMFLLPETAAEGTAIALAAPCAARERCIVPLRVSVR